jgi:hypothetical protein
MKLKRKLTSIVLAATIICIPISVYAKLLENGELYYNGGQTDSIVYSEVGEASGHDHEWMVKATVKVGNNTYTTGYQDDYAYKEADRVWYANETSYYDYYLK